MAKRQYEFSLKGFGLFGGLVFMTALGVSLLYGSLYGFTFFGQELASASKLMTAALQQPQAVHNFAQQGMRQPGMHHQLQPGMQMTAPAQTGTGQAGQYLCPQHGPVGSPVFDPGGVPHCPLDQQIMQFNPATSPLGQTKR